MTKREIQKLFEDKKIRTIWDDEQEKWYFSIVARVAREQLEAKTGRKVVSPLSAKRFFEGQKDQGLLDNDVEPLNND